MNVLIKPINPIKLNPRYHGPYDIAQVYTNGTVKIQHTPALCKWINICRLLPCHNLTQPLPELDSVRLGYKMLKKLVRVMFYRVPRNFE